MTTLVKHKKEQINEFRELAMIAARSGHYKDMSQESLLNLMLSAADLGVSPMKAINGSFHVIKGKITMSGHLINDRIRAAGHSIRVIEHTREKCVIIGIRKDNQDSYKSEFDMEDAKLAGLLGSPTWKTYPKDMLYNRAIARLGRILFSDVVGACYSEDEGFDIQNTPMQERVSQDPDEITIPTQSPVEMDDVGELVEFKNSLDELKEAFAVDGISTENLEEYLKFISTRKGKPVEDIISSALEPELLKSFKEAYIRKFVKKPEVVQQDAV